MMDIKKLAAGIIAGAAITAAPLMAFAAPASAATDASNPTATAASHGRAFSGAEGPRTFSGTQGDFGNSSAFAHECCGVFHCDECGS